MGWEMSEQSKRENREMPVSSPFCSDPECPDCKELRELQEEMRRKSEQGSGAA